MWVEANRDRLKSEVEAHKRKLDWLNSAGRAALAVGSPGPESQVSLRIQTATETGNLYINPTMQCSDATS